MPSISRPRLNFLMNKKQKLYLEEIDKNPPKVFNGFLKLLIALKKQGIKIAVASSSKNVRYILSKIRIIDEFDAVISGNDFKKSKPDPDIFLTAAKSLKTRPENCLVFEDAGAGVRAARNANMHCIGFASSDNETELEKSGADLVIKSF